MHSGLVGSNFQQENNANGESNQANGGCCGESRANRVTPGSGGYREYEAHGGDESNHRTARDEERFQSCPTSLQVRRTALHFREGELHFQVLVDVMDAGSNARRSDLSQRMILRPEAVVAYRHWQSLLELEESGKDSKYHRLDEILRCVGPSRRDRQHFDVQQSFSA